MPSLCGQRNTDTVDSTHFDAYLPRGGYSWLVSRKDSVTHPCFTACIVVQGYVPGLIGTTHGAIQIVIYDALKRQYNARRKHHEESIEKMVCLRVFEKRL